MKYKLTFKFYVLLFIITSKSIFAEQIANINSDGEFYKYIYKADSLSGPSKAELPGSNSFKYCQAMMNNGIKETYKSMTPVNWSQNIATNLCSKELENTNSSLKDSMGKFELALRNCSSKPNESPEYINCLLVLKKNYTAFFTEVDKSIFSDNNIIENFDLSSLDYPTITKLLTHPPVKTNFAKLKTCETNYLKMVPDCIAMVGLLKSYDRSFENAEHTKPATAQSSNQPAVINQGASGLNVTQNSNYGCKSSGIETLDYEACKKFSDYDAGLEMATQAFKTGQTLVYQNKAMDTQFEATKNMANDATAGLKAQKSNFKDQEEAFTQNSAVEASKAAYLGTIRYSEFPTEEKVLQKCSSINSNVKNLWNTEMNQGVQLNFDLANNCKQIVTNPERGFDILSNQQASEKMTARCVNLGVKAVAEGVNAVFAGKRADQVDGAIANVNGFQPTTTPGIEAAVNTTYCQMNPTAPQCLNQQPTQFSTIGDNIVEFGGGGVGTAYGAGTVDNNGTTGATNGAVNNAANGASTKTIGSAIVSVPKDSGIIDPVGAATLSAAKPNAGGGGGGGGGGASAGSGPGGLPQAQPQGGVSSAVGVGKKESYTAGGGISMLGGRGTMAAAKKGNESGNPFSGLMDKKGPAADKNVNFRGPASVDVGNKGDNIFNMISKRYGWANDQKLMLEYENK